ncbi:NADH dehydrogenase [Saccharospirillum sp. MSK14-1]|uniref:NAD(P)/FAD-dependent oxidoreductase n=1 Tax=Saccharospirillum sp. MSK14-1 TaxID=1897632 RepID=UPI000D388D35|nr:NAD(P)/FAD-dependent oxidoreductase [Saccharospirillum sp. MSK14-1]PTY35667.1 NADH dehydrogenase [Saccharospirillum sp. MSK14-1]
MSNDIEQIVIIGGGAGGLELATRLGRLWGRKGKARVTLIDRNNTHLWKPLLHEVAAGSLDAGVDEVNYRGHARRHGFHFTLGSVNSLDRDRREVILAPLVDEEGQTVLDERRVHYDQLIFALGSVTNDFGIPGIADHCMMLDAPGQAERFHRRLLNAFLQQDRARAAGGDEQLKLVIVGGGATGVELSAELYNAAKVMQDYDLDHIGPEHLQVSLLEAGPRILPALPDRIAGSVVKELSKLGVKVRHNTKVVRGHEGALETDEGEMIDGDIMVWAAGVRAPNFLKDLAGLESARNNQLMVNQTLQTTRDERIWALGDCCACPQSDGSWVPPRAQSAHQMSSHIFKNLKRQKAGKPLVDYHYKDHGSLISLSRFSTVGSLMGNLTRGSMMIEGRLARLVYISLYRQHQMALHGVTRTLMLALIDRLNHAIRPRLKLH